MTNGWSKNDIILDDLSKPELYNLIKQDIKRELPRGQKNNKNVVSFLKYAGISYKDTKQKLLDLYPTDSYIKKMIQKNNIDKVKIFNTKIRQFVSAKKNGRLTLINLKERFNIERKEEFKTHSTTFFKNGTFNINFDIQKIRNKKMNTKTIIGRLKETSKIYREDRCLVLDQNKEIIINSIREFVISEIRDSKLENFLWRLQANFDSMNSNHGRQVIFNNLKINTNDEDDSKIWVYEFDKMITLLPAQAQENYTNNEVPENNDYLYMFKGFQLMIVDLPNEGGCDSREHKNKPFYNPFDKKKYILTSLKSKNNNCLLNCFNRAFDIDKHAHTIKRELGYDIDDMIHFKDIRKIIDYYQNNFSLSCGCILLNSEGKIILEYKTNAEKVALLFLICDHYYICENMVQYKRCENCHDKLLDKNTTHKCNLSNKNYYENYIQGQNKWVKTINKERKFQTDLSSSFIVYDFETYTHSINKKLIPYAVGFKKIGDSNWDYFYDESSNTKDSSFIGKDYSFIDENAPAENCVYKFVDYLLQLQNFGMVHKESNFESRKHKNIPKSKPAHQIPNRKPILVKPEIEPKPKIEIFISAYNGSRFDQYCVIEELKRRNIKINDYINVCGKVLKFSFMNDNGIKISSFDLYNFLNCSLADACKNFKTHYEKQEFEHDSIKNWDVIKKKKDEIIKYLQFDVLSLEELIIKTADCFYKKFKINLHEYITLSHLGYSIWSSTIIGMNISLPKNFRDYQIIRKSIFGGRTYPLANQYESQHYAQVKNIIGDNSIKYEDKLILIQKIYHEALNNTQDFIYNADVNSLYPAAMLNLYPIGEYRYSKNPSEDFHNKKFGIYKIKFKANTNLIIAPFPTKEDNGRLTWDVLHGEGYYNNIDIQNALDTGYEITFLDEAIVWDETDYIWNNYVDMMYDWKKNSSDNPVERSIAKLLLNSPYGKTLQRPIIQDSKFVSNFEELIKFINSHTLTDWVHIGDQILMTGDVNELKRKDGLCNKPTHIGSFILSYSRKIMLDYMRLISADLTEHPFTYSDTDSMHILGKHYHMLKNMKLNGKSVIGDEIGQLSNDLKLDGIILKECNLGPKLYTYFYINSKGEWFETNKCKGVPSNDPLTKEPTKLASELYYSDKSIEIDFNSIKKIHGRVTQIDKEKGFTNFTLKSTVSSRTFNKNKWTGFILYDNLYYPPTYTGQKPPLMKL